MSTSTAIKRSRSHQRDAPSYGQPPPKKQAIDVPATLRTPVRRSRADAGNPGKIAAPSKKPLPRPRNTATTAGTPPAFADFGQQQVRKAALAASITVRTTTTTNNHTVVNEQQTEDVKAWQKHYRKAFPAYVFFFEAIPMEVMMKASDQIQDLGATCEKYFSSKVTHVITTRVQWAPHETAQPSTTARSTSRTTANPALVDQRVDARKGGRFDVLLKAREYGMKIWAVEKLDRVLNVLFEFDISRPCLTTAQRNQITNTHINAQHNDLSHILKQERLHGPADRDPSVASKELQFWKGPYIYIYDMIGATRPIIVREYPKVQHREEGTWPQFRSVSGGKCPFIEEHVHQRREKDRMDKLEPAKVAEKERPKEVPEAKVQSKAFVAPAAKMIEQKPRQVQSVKEATMTKERSPVKPKAYVGRSKRTLAEISRSINSRTTTATGRPVAEATAQDVSARRTMRPENTIAFTATNESNSQTTRRSNVEPAASGVQPSNITSAIRSQMVSSYLDQLGHRAGTSKEMHALHRKVASNVMTSNPTVSRPASMARRSTDLLARAAENEARTVRGRTTDGRGKLAKVEESVQSSTQRSSQEQVVQRRPKPDPKPGYCENCREKFDDFAEHTQSRQHRKFAVNSKNWAELDKLLLDLRRPLRSGRYRF